MSTLEASTSVPRVPGLWVVGGWAPGRLDVQVKHLLAEGYRETCWWDGGRRLLPADDSLSIHELRPAPRPREVFLLWHAGRTHPPLAARAIELAVEVAAGLRGSPQRAEVRD